jgi:hypothetical protein
MSHPRPTHSNVHLRPLSNVCASHVERREAGGENEADEIESGAIHVLGPTAVAMLDVLGMRRMLETTPHRTARTVLDPLRTTTDEVGSIDTGEGSWSGGLKNSWLGTLILEWPISTKDIDRFVNVGQKRILQFRCKVIEASLGDFRHLSFASEPLRLIGGLHVSGAYCLVQQRHDLRLFPLKVFLGVRDVVKGRIRAVNECGNYPLDAGTGYQATESDKTDGIIPWISSNRSTWLPSMRVRRIVPRLDWLKPCRWPRER